MSMIITIRKRAILIGHQFTVSPVYHSNEHETVANPMWKIDLVYHLFFVCVYVYVIE